MNPDPHARLLELDAACRNVQQATAAILRRVERGGERATPEEYAGARSAVLRALLHVAAGDGGDPAARRAGRREVSGESNDQGQ